MENQCLPLGCCELQEYKEGQWAPRMCSIILTYYSQNDQKYNKLGNSQAYQTSINNRFRSMSQDIFKKRDSSSALTDSVHTQCSNSCSL